MKRCPTCEKTFDDNMRFCQVDGTPLVEAAEPVDLYKTMVARPEDIAAAMPPADAPKKEEEPVLEIPEEKVDPNKTMYASESEIRSAMADADSQDEPVMDLPPMPETPAPEPPKFIEPALSEPPKSESAPPPSPFSRPDDAAFTKTTPPIPSPFDAPQQMSSEPPVEPVFAAPEPVRPASDPFNVAPPAGNAPIAMAESDPPVIENSNWQEQDMQNPQFQQGGPAAAAGQNQTLAIVSLVVGILSLFCCAWFIPGIVAIVLGFLARGKANSDPANYGGAGLALGGIIAGAVSLLLGLIVLVLYFLGFAASMMQGM